MFNHSDYPNAEPVFLVVREFLKDNLLANLIGQYSSHPVWRFEIKKSFESSRILNQLSQCLDELAWQLVTTGEKREDNLNDLMVVAPRIKVTVDKGHVYHVTPVRLRQRILREGLKPSTTENSLSKFPDVIDKIHCCLELKDQEGSAEWWAVHFQNRYGENFGIFEVTLTELPPNARIYRDTHSRTGIVIDRIVGIGSDKLRWIS